MERRGRGAAIAPGRKELAHACIYEEEHMPLLSTLRKEYIILQMYEVPDGIVSESEVCVWGGRESGTAITYLPTSLLRSA